jgi:hypothetical protein
LADNSRTFEQNFADFQSRYRARRQAMDKSLGTAMAKVRLGMVEAARKVAAAHGVSLIIPRAQVLVADDKLSLTKDIIVLMDKNLPRVDFPPPVIEVEGGQGGTATEPRTPVSPTPVSPGGTHKNGP